MKYGELKYLKLSKLNYETIKFYTNQMVLIVLIFRIEDIEGILVDEVSCDSYNNKEVRKHHTGV